MPLTMPKTFGTLYRKGMVTFIKDNFRHLQARLREAGVQEIDGICYDLECLVLSWTSVSVVFL